MDSSPILVVGSTGKTGRRIVDLLVEKGIEVRHGSRQSNPAFDWEDPMGWPAVFEGVESAYVSFFPDLAVPEAPAAIEELTSCARAVGVKRLVLLSGRGEANAERCENIVRQSGLEFTLVRASWFFQNFSEGHLLEPVLEGVVALPAGQVHEPFVDADDIAEVAVAALTDGRHVGQLYEVTGPRLISFAAAVGEIAEASGREVSYVPVCSDDYRHALTQVAGPELANMLTDLCDEVLDGRNATLGDGVQRALGRAPREFMDFCRSTAATGVWNP
jgi:uncharacterized protein YbjT (DUF2867 family)